MMVGRYIGGKHALFPFIVFALLAGIVPPSANASVQGHPGGVSKEMVNISIRKSVVAGITGMNDMALGSASPKDGAVWSSDVCIYSATGSYSIAAIGSRAADGNFVMSNGAQALAYNVVWNDGGAGHLSDNGVALKPGVPSTLGKATTANPTCHRGAAFDPTARLIIKIPPAIMQVASSGKNFADSLTLLVSPN